MSKRQSPQSANTPTLDELRAELAAREARALGMGGAERIARRRERGQLDARARIDVLLDEGTFLEVGLLGVSAYEEAERERTPADGKITGFGKVEGRMVGVVSNDFTVKGASSSLTNMKKIAHVKRVATERGFPLIFFGESSGARMPDNMGARGMGLQLGHDPQQYVREREIPWVSAVLGHCFGSSAWYSCLSDFTVMRKGAIMAVGSPGLASLAIGQKVEPEDLGGWRLHSEVTGLVDRVVETDEEAIAEMKRFLSYMPSNRNQVPPRAPVPDGGAEPQGRISDIVPTERRRGYDVHRIIEALADRASFFEMKPRFGRTVAAGLARLDGRVVGIIANNPMHKAGALDVPGCEKATRLAVLCDSFNIPLILLVDTPGFIIGVESERLKAPGKIMNMMAALQMCTVPKLSVIMRKSYGQAYLNMGGGRNSDDVVLWPTAEVSFMDPYFATEIVTWGQKASEEEKARIRDSMERDSAPWGLAEVFSAQAVIDPDETRAYLARQLEIHELRMTGGVGRHRLCNWPTTY